MPSRARSAAPLAAALFGASLAAACGRPDRSGADGDSALARDVTLVASTSRPARGDSLIGGGDTATVLPPDTLPLPAAPAEAPAPAPAVAARAPSPGPRPTAPRPVTAPPTAARSTARDSDDARASAAPRQTVAARPAPASTAAQGGATVPPTTPPPPAPSAGAAPGVAAGRSLGAGTVLAGTLSQRICAESSRPGDRLVATLGGDASGPAGIVLPAGTPLVLEVVRVAGDPLAAEFLARGVSVAGEFVPIVADVSPVTGATERRRVIDKPTNNSRAVQGAVAGAVLGQVLGRDTKSTVIGAAGGAAAGAALGRGKSHEETCVASGAAVRLRLTERFAAR